MGSLTEQLFQAGLITKEQRDKTLAETQKPRLSTKNRSTGREKWVRWNGRTKSIWDFDLSDWDEFPCH